LANLFSPEKVYATVGTFYPDADPETSTVDGYARRSAVVEAFSTIRNGAGVTVDDTFHLISQLAAAATTNNFDTLGHVYILFDTSSLGAGAIISSAIFSGYFQIKSNNLGSPDLHLASSTPASNTGLVSADYQQVGRTSFGSITYANFTASQYNDITLNASGISNISKTGISKFSLQFSWDINNSFTGAWVADVETRMAIFSADNAGTTQDPKLVVTYTVPINPKQDIIWFD